MVLIVFWSIASHPRIGNNRTVSTEFMRRINSLLANSDRTGWTRRLCYCRRSWTELIKIHTTNENKQNNIRKKVREKSSVWQPNAPVIIWYHRRIFHTITMSHEKYLNWEFFICMDKCCQKKMSRSGHMLLCILVPRIFTVNPSNIYAHSHWHAIPLIHAQHSYTRRNTFRNMNSATGVHDCEFTAISDTR